MKTLKYFLAILILSISVLGCSKDDNNVIENNPVEGLHKIYEISQIDHVVEIYSAKMNLEVGYNELSIRILDKASNTYLTNAAPSWMPMMHMEAMAHSGPHGNLDNAGDATVYKGFIVFQMAGNEMDYWELGLDYTFNSQPFTLTKRIDVMQPADGLKKVQVFTGSDEVRYILAYVNPQSPKVAINDLQAVLFKMEDMMTFPMVENYKISVDPRMPSMGNHSSPNNRDMTYNSASKIYEGKLSLTMTGLWNINMKLFNQNDDLIKGEDVTEDHPVSSLYFELEF